MDKTLESMFIAEYEELQKQLELANKKIVELQAKKEEESIEKAEQPVFIKTISKECCYLEVMSEYNIVDTSYFKDLTSEDVRKIIDSDEELRKAATAKDDHWSYSDSNIVSIRTKAFPYTARVQDHLILLDFYWMSGEFHAQSQVLSDELSKNRYIDISRKEELYEYGLTLLKKELEGVYKRKLKKETEEEQK